MQSTDKAQIGKNDKVFNYKKVNSKTNLNKWFDDFLLPFCIVKELKFEFFLTFLSSIIFGQISVIISFILSLVYLDTNYLNSIIKNGDMLAISMALLGTYFAFLITEFNYTNDIFMKNIKITVISTYILIEIIELILLVIIKLDTNLNMNNGLICMQIILSVITLFLTIYSICLINVNKYREKIERNNDAAEYLEDEQEKMKDIKRDSNKDLLTREGYRI